MQTIINLELIGFPQPDVVNQHRVLLFCQLKSMMDIVENDLLKTMPNVTYLRMDGSIPSSSRFDLVNKFNNDPSIDIFLLSTSVGKKPSTTVFRGDKLVDDLIFI